VLLDTREKRDKLEREKFEREKFERAVSELSGDASTMSISTQPVARSAASAVSGTTTSAASSGSSADAAGAGEERRCACPGCPNYASSMCDACKSVVYCSRACQKQHWPAHKAACKVKRPGMKK
jgi:hypothetical protein